MLSTKIINKNVIDQIQVLRDLLNIDLSKKKSVLIKSPLRRDDNPSFAIFKNSKSGVIFYKDFSTGESGNIYKLAMQLINNEGHNYTYSQILSMLYNKSRDIIISSIEQVEKDYEKDYVFNVKFRGFTPRDIEYWKQYYIDTKRLTKYNIHSVREYVFKKKDREYKSNVSPNDLTFFFECNNGRGKIYKPLSDTRFINIGSIPYLGLLPKQRYQTTIITKSLKDVMVYDVLKYYAIASNSEGSLISDETLDIIFSNSDKIFINYDSDTTGIRESGKLASRHGFNEIFFKSENSKDISDYIKEFGYEKTLTDLKKQLI